MFDLWKMKVKKNSSILDGKIICFKVIKELKALIIISMYYYFTKKKI